MEKKYLEEYDLGAHFARVAPRKRALFERRLADMKMHSSTGRRLCDVGCAGGQFLELAAASGWEPYGIELNPPAIERARSTGATIFAGRLEELDDLPWETFDVVTCWDVLEHTPEPTAFAERLRRLPRGGGHIFLTTLNWDSLVRRVFGTHWSLMVEDHFTYWSIDALKLLFASICEIVDLRAAGLGRDFVSPIDTLITKYRRAKQTERSAVSSPDTWDATRPVLAAERALNAVLARTQLGVELFGTFRPTAL